MKSQTKSSRDMRRLESELEHALNRPLIGSPDYDPPRRLPISAGLILGLAGSVAILMLLGTVVGIVTGARFE